MVVLWQYGLSCNFYQNPANFDLLVLHVEWWGLASMYNPLRTNVRGTQYRGIVSCKYIGITLVRTHLISMAVWSIVRVRKLGFRHRWRRGALITTSQYYVCEGFWYHPQITAVNFSRTNIHCIRGVWLRYYDTSIPVPHMYLHLDDTQVTCSFDGS